MMYTAGADTTAITLTSFFLAMVMNPKVQRKAQEEIDNVIGTDRLPRFEDRDKLPYVESVVQEAYRWFPVVPLCFPHAMLEDAIEKGYNIPKGAIILPAIWWFLHDPEVYAEPDVFDPERFLEPRKEPDPKNEAFGYGRRVCPGRNFADSSVFLTIAKTLAALDITKAVNNHGKEIEVKFGVTPGVLSHPLAFSCNIEPRSKKHAELVRSVEVEQPREESDASRLCITTTASQLTAKEDVPKTS
ncbi:cytochrome p450 [Hirsutella rhossiliensis]|uniref:Cytochrome p450 domain-containing protein n=1 Tax=Hirsutella rhossiliensis TaxID=111463 RepID=A0A9P8N6B2_9HYPO|nr:cytochrome p450 domain-containing protein [Hirsutella rhossiliensis]KAH0967772.1 cytochrome p450 domain-containing protein [Hirsutella rhossiliensis]